MAEINPYAPVVIDDASPDRAPVHERIFFSGTLTEADCQTVLLDQMPGGKAAFGWLHLAFLILLLASVQWLVGISASLLPILWVVGAMVVSPIWMGLVGKYWNRGARVRYSEALCANAKATRGWCDQDGLVKFDETSALRATWQHFDRTFLFERAINLLVQADARLRVVLPWHFFASAGEYAAARALVAAKLPDAGAKQKTDPFAVSPQRSFDGKRRTVDEEHVRQWSVDEWPFPSTTDRQRDFVLEPWRVANSLATRLKVIGVATALLLSFGFPFLAGTVGYVVLKYSVTGGWDYLWDDWFLQIVILIPVGLFFVFLFLTLAGRIRSMREAQLRLLFIRLREEGMYIRREGVEVWMKRDEILSPETDEEAVGWSMPVQVDSVRFPREMFADEESFQAFGEQLSRYRRGNDSL